MSEAKRIEELEEQVAFLMAELYDTEEITKVHNAKPKLKIEAKEYSVTVNHPKWVKRPEYI